MRLKQRRLTLGLALCSALIVACEADAVKGSVTDLNTPLSGTPKQQVSAAPGNGGERTSPALTMSSAGDPPVSASSSGPGSPHNPTTGSVGNLPAPGISTSNPLPALTSNQHPVGSAQGPGGMAPKTGSVKLNLQVK